MEVQSKQSPMVEWAVRKDGGASKAMFIQSNWESQTHKARARRSHTGHRDKFKQSTANVYRWCIDSKHSDTQIINYNTRRTI